MDRVVRGLARLLEDLLGYVFLVITLAVVVLVILRYFFLTTIVGGQEFTVFCFIYTSAIGAAVLLYKGEHIAIPLLVDRFPPRARRWMRRINYLEVALLNGVGRRPEHSLDPFGRPVSLARPPNPARGGALERTRRLRAGHPVRPVARDSPIPGRSPAGR